MAAISSSLLNARSRSFTQPPLPPNTILPTNTPTQSWTIETNSRGRTELLQRLHHLIDILEGDPSRQLLPDMAYRLAPELEQLNPPPIGKLFTNHGPYISTRGTDYDPHLRNELNIWTGPRGYAVSIARTRQRQIQCRIDVECSLSGKAKYRPGRAEKTEHEVFKDHEQRLKAAAEAGDRKPKRLAVSRKTNCPFKFKMIEDKETPGKYIRDLYLICLYIYCL
jgi:hypothetical protein